MLKPTVGHPATLDRKNRNYKNELRLLLTAMFLSPPLLCWIHLFSKASNPDLNLKDYSAQKTAEAETFMGQPD